MSKKAVNILTLILVAVICIASTILACLFIFPRTSSNNSGKTATTTNGSESEVIQKYEYSLEECPIQVHDIAIETLDKSNKLELSIQWYYENEREHLIVDEIIFYATGYKSNGEVINAPRLYTHKGPISNGDTGNTRYEQSWLSDGISYVKVHKIKIKYTDNNFVEIYSEPIQETTTAATEVKFLTLEDCPIKVTSCYPSAPNSADGVDLHINWYSEDTKEIKYIYFYVTPYNRVNDIQTCEIRDYSTYGGYVTGPFNYGASDYSYWDCAWYNNDIDHIELDKIVIQYMDGTSEYYY